MNSLRSRHQALAHESRRKGKILDGGGAVARETRHWDERGGAYRSGRSREESIDYRYFTEPDLVPLAVDHATVSRILALPELPAARRALYVAAGIEREHNADARRRRSRRTVRCCRSSQAYAHCGKLADR